MFCFFFDSNFSVEMGTVVFLAIAEIRCSLAGFKIVIDWFFVLKKKYIDFRVVLQIYLRDASVQIFLYLLVNLSVYLFMCVSPLTKQKTIKTRNLVHTFPWTIPKTFLFCFLEKVNLVAASLEILLRQVDFRTFT